MKDAESAYERFESTEIPDGYDGCMLDRMVGGAGLDHVPPLIGRHVDVIVSRGNPVMADGVDTGDYYRRYDWAVVQDEEQPQ